MLALTMLHAWSDLDVFFRISGVFKLEIFQCAHLRIDNSPNGKDQQVNEDQSHQNPIHSGPG